MEANKYYKISDYLGANAYPGRGIIMGKTPDGKYGAAAYFIMGRSQNSRNRVFAQTQDGIKTKAADPAKVTDPSLIIYSPVRYYDKGVIVTNGDQTDTIYNYFANGLSFDYALSTREFEPDAPNYTPRISGVLFFDGDYKLSILKSADNNGTACERFTFSYPGLFGRGHIIHTYARNGNPLPPFFGEPVRVQIPGDLDNFTVEIWESLDNDNKISLFTLFVNTITGERKYNILNKYTEVK